MGFNSVFKGLNTIAKTLQTSLPYNIMSDNYCAFTETEQHLGPIVSSLGRNKVAERRPVDIDGAILK